MDNVSKATLFDYVTQKANRELKAETRLEIVINQSHEKFWCLLSLINLKENFR